MDGRRTGSEALMSNLNDVRVEIAGKLTANGVTVSTDPKVQVPAVLVGAPSVTGNEGVGGWRVEYPITVLAAPPGDAHALEWMLDQVEAILPLYPGAAFPRLTDHNGSDVPSYVITVSKFVANPNC
jgi:hypothetical protein